MRHGEENGVGNGVGGEVGVAPARAASSSRVSVVAALGMVARCSARSRDVFMGRLGTIVQITGVNDLGLPPEEIFGWMNYIKNVSD